MGTTALIQIGILIILILLSGYFSSAETAFSSLNQVEVRSQADAGDKRAKKVLSILENYSKMMSTVLICNNVVNISASSLTTTVIISTFGANAVSIGTAVLTVLIILFGEITPKNISRLRALETAKKDAGVIRALMWILTPIIFLIDKMADGILKLHGINKNEKRPITERELKTYVDVGHEDGVIEGGEKKIIYNVFDFGDSLAKDIMVPRIDMVCVASDATWDEIMAIFRREMFTRIPVYTADDPDNIIGHLNMKDFIFMKKPDHFRVTSFLHESYYTYEYKKTADLMREMQQSGYGVAFVLDEYGTTVGMITNEDLVEEIVGDIRDEYDQDEKKVIKYDDLTYLVDGSMSLDDVNDQLGTDFTSEDYDSIGGLMIEQLDRLPRNGEIVTLKDGTTLQAKGLRGNRIIKVLLRFREKPETEAETKQDPDDSENTRKAQ
ncbi:MAG TPA: hemolysin [Lachnospiraceae bacterium]|jgi:putative hemolysin|nr:hemolysin [Lachnospiraceae bacterium]